MRDTLRKYAPAAGVAIGLVAAGLVFKNNPELLHDYVKTSVLFTVVPAELGITGYFSGIIDEDIQALLVPYTYHSAKRR